MARRDIYGNPSLVVGEDVDGIFAGGLEGWGECSKDSYIAMKIVSSEDEEEAGSMNAMPCNQFFSVQVPLYRSGGEGRAGRKRSGCRGGYGRAQPVGNTVNG
jgi:hypothetical protein